MTFIALMMYLEWLYHRNKDKVQSGSLFIPVTALIRATQLLEMETGFLKITESHSEISKVAQFFLKVPDCTLGTCHCIYHTLHAFSM